MIEWLLCVAVVVASVLLMPVAIRYSLKSRRLRGSGAAIGDALNGFYDPEKKRAQTHIERRLEIGDHEDGEMGDKP